MPWSLLCLNVDGFGKQQTFDGAYGRDYGGGTQTMTWWVLGVSMFLFSLFLWPSPSVALVGAILLPFAGKARAFSRSWRLWQ